MTGVDFGPLGEPSLMLGAIAAAAAVCVLSLGLQALILIAARRRLDAIDVANAETAARMAGELRRLRAMTSRRAGDDLPSHADPEAPVAPRLGAKRVLMPLRKTVH